ncbi:MAG: Chromosomal replication initiator protein dnaA [candidate division TM6 bacterium GW2011_GWF2_43_17]|nr:MAG: Chromosomal replication initiator protein dnaA [candidate division TM6 bacterium GW2011_GWF2_43_17]
MSTEELWQDFLKVAQEELGSRVVDTWFKALQVASWNSRDRLLVLRAPNLFVKKWVSSHYHDFLQAQFARLFGEETVNVRIEDNLVPAAPLGTIAQKQQVREPLMVVQPARALAEAVYPSVLSQKRRLTSKSPKEAAQAGEIKPELFRDELVDRFRFDTFVDGPSNTLAFSAAQAVAENVGRLYNPLFIYGGSGLGKTHLLHAIGNYLRTTGSRARIVYQSADHFVNEFVAAIRKNKVAEFEQGYRLIDVLLMDDVQFISKKEQTQEAFFRVFNLLHQAGKQIVFTADSLPCDIVGLAERVRSRLEGGLIADIQVPSLETKIAILQKKAELQNYVLEDDVAYFVASAPCSSVRELEGLLIRVVAFAALMKQPLTVGLAGKALSQIKDVRKECVTGLPGIARFVAKQFNYTVRDLRSARRNKDLVIARHAAMYLMKQRTAFSLRDIGLFFERKDHTTVIHAIHNIEDRIKKDPSFAGQMRQIEEGFISYDLRSGEQASIATASFVSMSADT